MKRISKALLYLLLVFFLLPVVALMVASLTEGNLFDSSGGVIQFSFRQYTEAFENTDLWLHFRNSAILAGGSMLAGFPVALLGGFFLDRARGTKTRIIRLAMIVALLLPVQSIMVPVFRLCKQTGLYDTIWPLILLQAFSPLGPLIGWLLAREIPEEQWEAGLLDCNSLTRIYLKAILPQMIPGMLVLILLSFAEAWNMVEWPLILLPDPFLQPASLVLNDITPSGHVSFAAAMLYSLPVLLFCHIVVVLKSH